MFYSEDTTTREADDHSDDRLLILDGTARLDYFDQKPEIPKKTKLQVFLDYIKEKL